MSETRRPVLLDDWDEITRTARRPPIRARVSSRISPPAGAVLLVVSLVLAVVAMQGLNSLGPRGSGGTPSVSFGPDAGRADWWLDPADLPLKPDTRVLRGFLQERECASGQSPEGRILGPRIEYRVDEVIVTFRVREIGGRCPSNPSYPVTIALDEPLGDRVLVDGGTGRDAAIDPTIMSWGPVAVFRSDARMEARNEGTLVITADCTFLERNGQRELLAWPAPETTWDPAFAQISFMRRDGQVVSVRNGQYVVLGGGGSSRNEGGLTGEEWANQVTWVARPKAACLVDERFLVSDVME